MSTRTLISVAEYLASSYRPDCDYVDGVVEERNLGERTHSGIQGRLVAYFFSRYENEGIKARPGIRVHVTPTRFRVPDVCVVLGDPGEEILTKPPFLCIEVLSPEDRMSRIEERINDYLEMGVRFVWVMDPYTKQAYCATPARGLQEVKDGVLRTDAPAFELPLAEIFR